MHSPTGSYEKVVMFPDPAACTGDEKPLSYYICVDDAFPL